METKMHHRALAAAIAASAMLSGCATIDGILPGGPPGSELAGRTLRMEPARGQMTMLSFQRDGVVRAAFGSTVVPGRWEVANRNLCFYWSGAPRECWPYDAPFRRGETRTITSDRGNLIRVTMM
jgi:hypothetical protein